MKPLSRPKTALGIAALLALWPAVGSAQAGPPVSYQAAADADWAGIAARHGVTLEALRRANPGGTAEDGWLILPRDARLPEGPVVALMASAKAEIAEIVRAMEVQGVYRIVGREFHVGDWEGRPVLAGVTGGNQANAAIGATILFAHFNVRAMGFVGIAGGGGATRVGDVLIASGAVQHDHGNWYDFEMAGGETFAGMTWSPRGGPPVLSDSGRRAPRVLFPAPALAACLRAGGAGVALPPIGQGVARFHEQEPYRPDVILDGWSASGAQFITSRHTRQTLEWRMVAEALALGVAAPAAFIVDQEDFGAILAAEEHDVPWFIIRTVVDLAGQRDDGGLPLSLYDTPEAIPDWLAAHRQQSYARNFDWSYFYRQIEIVARPIVRRLSADEGCFADDRPDARS